MFWDGNIRSPELGDSSTHPETNNQTSPLKFSENFGMLSGLWFLFGGNFGLLSQARGSGCMFQEPCIERSTKDQR